MAERAPGTDEAQDTAGAGTSTPSAAEVFRRLGPVGVLAVIATAFPFVGFLLTVYYINPLAEWFRAHGDSGPWVYAGLYALLAGLALLPTNAQTALGGWAFGARVGGIAAMAAVVTAAVLTYFIARTLAGERAVRLIAEHAKWRAVYAELMGSSPWRALLMVIMLRLAQSPFALTNVVLAAARTPVAAYVVGTIIGFAPRTLALVYIAAQLRSIRDAARHPWIYWGGLAATAIVAVTIAALARRALQRVGAGSAPAPRGEPAR
jgi:uncharacterized membrane protein YdjX (TVP38/TMEM64 family)